jgi:predicted ABC-type ATPase
MNTDQKPTYTLIAGINGAGKSTSYDEMDDDEKSLLGPRINPDELTAQLGGNIIKGGQLASRRRKQFLSENITFHQETTFTGNTIIKAIDQAKRQGYRLNLIYVGLDSVDTAMKRVKHRAANGGHNVPVEDIVRRYPNSMRNLSEQIHKFDRITLVDNTQRFEFVFKATDGDVVFICDDLPKWVQNAVRAYENHIQSQTTVPVDYLKRFESNPEDEDTLIIPAHKSCKTAENEGIE